MSSAGGSPMRKRKRVRSLPVRLRPAQPEVHRPFKMYVFHKLWFELKCMFMLNEVICLN